MAINYDDTGGRVAELESLLPGAPTIQVIGGHTSFFSVQLKNIRGNNIAKSTPVRMWITDAVGSGAVSSRSFGDWSWTGGGGGAALTVGKHYLSISTSTTGAIGFQATCTGGSGTVYLAIEVMGQVYYSDGFGVY